MPAVTSGRWTPTVVRVQTLIGFCHALALVDAIRGRTAAWVPTGVAKKTPTAKRVLRVIRMWVLVTQTAFWVGVAMGC
jgi:cellulose synthase (UDP-forming)